MVYEMKIPVAEERENRDTSKCGHNGTYYWGLSNHLWAEQPLEIEARKRFLRKIPYGVRSSKIPGESAIQGGAVILIACTGH